MSVNVTVLVNENPVSVTASPVNAIINVSTDTFASARAVQAAAEAEAAALQTAADRVQTGLDVIATNADAIATAADRVQTGLDVQATNADVLITNADALQTGADRVQTGLDVISSGDNATTAQLAAASIESSIQALGSISGTVDIDLTLGTLITATLTGTTTLTFSGLPPSTRETAFTLRFAGIEQINLPAGTKYPSGSVPTPEGALYELPCSINSAGNLIVYGVINDIKTP
jgi:hypothetical protein